MLSLTDSESALVAAVVAAVAALIGVGVNVALSRHALRRQEFAHETQTDLKMWTDALSYLEGGSQRRSAGIAMLAILRSRKVDDEFQDQVYQVFHTQSRYLLVHGSNRGEGHEIANLTLMVKSLMDERGRAWMDKDVDRSKLLLADLQTYVEYAPTLKSEKGSNPAAIDYLLECIHAWQVGLSPHAE